MTARRARSPSWAAAVARHRNQQLHGRHLDSRGYVVGNSGVRDRSSTTQPFVFAAAARRHFARTDDGRGVASSSTAGGTLIADGPKHRFTGRHRGDRGTLDGNTSSLPGNILDKAAVRVSDQPPSRHLLGACPRRHRHADRVSRGGAQRGPPAGKMADVCPGAIGPGDAGRTVVVLERYGSWAA